MYKVRNLAFDRTNIGFDDGCVVSFRDGFGMVPDHHFLTFQISSSYSILTHTDDQPTPTVSEPIPTVAEPIATVSEPIPTASEAIPTVAEPVDESAETPTAEITSEEGDGKDA